MERAKPKLDRLKNIYLNTLEVMKTNHSTYCKGLTSAENLSEAEMDELKSKVESAYEKIVLTTSYEEATKDTDLIIEAILENPEEKIAFYNELTKYAR